MSAEAKPKLTPMMQQYMQQKQQYSDMLLFFRMGDFFEMFYEDAVVAAKVLDIALTKRVQKDDQIPMCGVPAHSYEPYLHKLISAGYKVAICDQLESPEEAKKRGYKEIVRREVVRVITPGTLTEENLLDSDKSNYLLSFAKQGKSYGIAWVDISTGSFQTSQISASTFASELSRINPSEILLADDMLYEQDFFESYGEWKHKLTPQAANIFDPRRAENKLKSFYKVISLESFGALSKAETTACGALLEYLELTQKDALPALEFPKLVESKHFMQIDPATRTSLELTKSNSASGDGPFLLQTINRTATAAGARELYHQLSSPLVYAEGINTRLDSVEFFFENSDILQKLQSHLSETPDFERAVARICIGRGTGRDMLSIRTALSKAQEIRYLLEAQELPELLRSTVSGVNHLPSLLGKLVDAFKDEVGVHLKDGNFIRPGFHPELDKLINIRDHSRKLVNDLKEKYAVQTGVEKLKINHNNILGFYVEVTAQNASKLGEDFIHRQTMANAMRFTTAELSDLQTKIISAADEALRLELEIFSQIAAEIAENSSVLTQTAAALAQLDVFQSHAALAAEKNYVKPKIDNSDEFKISKGRHPVVEANTDFTPNDCSLGKAQNLWLLTGPNMAGKSTFLRQNALIAILAQIGCYVPAAEAHIGCVDRVFSRVGAADDLAKGRSTFMVEMVETATILNQSTSKSLVILDEIGRGTATFDGLSIAWAVLEHLHNSAKCRTIFATHYHELTELETKLERLNLSTMRVREWEDDIIFTHEVVAGAADRSYGIHVAKLAGLPKSVTNRAQKILERFENEKSEPLPLFESAAPEPQETSKLDELLEDINPDELSPKEALQKLYELKDELKD